MDAPLTATESYPLLLPLPITKSRNFALRNDRAPNLARLRLRPTRRVQLSAVSYQRSAASRNRKGSVCQPTSEPRPMLCLYRSCLHKPASASPRESPALMRHNGPRSARYFGLGRALQGNRRPLGPCVAARHWPRGAHTRGVHAKGDVYAISKT